MTSDDSGPGSGRGPRGKSTTNLEERLHTLFDQAGDGILIADTATRGFVEANVTACRMLGYTRDELLGLGVEDIHPEDQLPYILEQFRRQMAQEISLAPDCMMQRKDGSVFRADITGTPIAFEGRSYLMGTLRDSRVRLEAERALREAEERYRTLFEQSPDGIVVIDPETLLPIEFNEQMLRVTGYSRSEFERCSVLDLEAVIPPEQIRPRVRGILMECREELETAIHRKDGTIAQVVLSVRALELGGRKVLHAVVRDVTARRRLEKQLLHAQKMEAVGRLAGGIAHDFNNVLTAIMGYGNLAMLNLPEGHAAYDHLGKILTAADRAARLTQGLLVFSRKRKPSTKPIPINEVVRLVEGLLQHLIGDDIEIETDLTEANPTVLADSGQIEQVLMNLATNARDAMPRGGSLRISTRVARIDEAFLSAHGFGEPGEYVRISFADSGLGMDAATRARVFEPFFTTKEVGKGTGLGLAVAYGIVKEHSGYITIASEPGSGTEVQIHLPLLVDDERALREASRRESPRGSETVLIAEEDAVTREILRSALEERGYAVVRATNGQEALDQFHRHVEGLDLVVLEARMSGRDGHEILEGIRRRRDDLKILFLTDHGGELPPAGVSAEGNVRFLAKPISPGTFVAAVREFLDA